MSSKELVDQFFKDLPGFTTIQDFEEHLCRFLSSGVHVEWVAGLPVYGFIRAEVGRINGLKIEIRSLEHPPPHFHVRGKGFDAAFCIEDGTLLAGEIDRNSANLIRAWFVKSRPLLIRKWNETRPDKCPVGLMREI